MSEMEEIYRDQAPSYGRFCTSVYTPEGIRQIDGRFSRAIQNADTLGECDHILKRLMENSHLHEKIVFNLLENLVRVRQHIQAGGVERHTCVASCFGEHGRTCCKKDFCEL